MLMKKADPFINLRISYSPNKDRAIRQKGEASSASHPQQASTTLKLKEQNCEVQLLQNLA